MTLWYPLLTMSYTRECPKCTSVIRYKSQSWMNIAETRKSLCKQCCSIRNMEFIDKHRHLPFEYLYKRLQRMSQDRLRRKVNLTYEEFLDFTHITACHYCGYPIKWYPHHETKRKTTYSYNLDRKDSNKCYSKDNCVVCCKVCNNAKSNLLTYEEMLILGHSIAEIRKLRTLLPPMTSYFPTLSLTGLHQLLSH